MKEKKYMLSAVKVQKLLDICKRRLDKEEKIKQIEKFVIEQHGEEIWQKIHNDVLEYDNIKQSIREKDKRYWMLISNPKTWLDERGDYIVNKCLYELDEHEIQRWKIDGGKDIRKQMKEGAKGIIKVSDDKRTKDERTDEEGGIVEKLESGIYGIFEIVKDEDGDCTYKTEDEYWYVNIKVIDNFYSKGNIIPKDDAIELLGRNVYSSMSSRKMDKNIYEKIIEYHSK